MSRLVSVVRPSVFAILCLSKLGTDHATETEIMGPILGRQALGRSFLLLHKMLLP